MEAVRPLKGDNSWSELMLDLGSGLNSDRLVGIASERVQLLEMAIAV